MADEQQFSISVPQSALDELHQKLALTKLPSAAPESDDEWDYGVPLADVQRLLARWKDGFDWRAAEAALNAELPQYTRTIEVDGHDAFTAHYVHKKSERANAIPLLFLHGCKCAAFHHRLSAISSPHRQGLDISLKCARSFPCSSHLRKWRLLHSTSWRLAFRHSASPLPRRRKASPEHSMRR